MRGDRPGARTAALPDDPVVVGEDVVAGRVPFDEALIGAWEARARRPGLFRSSLDGATRRRALRACGDQGRFWVQCNPGRSVRRAPTRGMSSVTAAFDPTAFHFAPGWINPEEVLMRLQLGGCPVDLLINVNPLGSAHGLIVIDPDAGRPQVLDEQGVRAAMAVASMSRRADFKVGFNSLQACASVNHYHFQCLYFRGQGVDDDLMPSERAAAPPRPILQGMSELVDHPARGWCFTDKVRGGVAHATAGAVGVLQRHEVAHNLLITAQHAIVIPRVHQGLVPPGILPGLAFLEAHGEMLVVGESEQQARQLEQAMTDEEVERQIGAIALEPMQFTELQEAIVAKLDAT